MAGEVSNQVKQLLKNDDSAVKLCVQGLYFLPSFLTSSSSYFLAFNNHHYLVHLPASFYPRQKDAITILRDCSNRHSGWLYGLLIILC